MKSAVELWTPVLLNGGIFKENYLVSNMGRVKQRHFFRNGSFQFVLMRIINSARPMVKMTGGGRQYRKSVAKLVLSSFNYREGCECANITYLDGNMKNCRLSNLRYAVDRLLYDNIEQEDKKVRKEKKLPDRPLGKMKPLIEGRSCKWCRNHPCFEGMDSLTSDFGAEGCSGYKPKEDINMN